MTFTEESSAGVVALLLDDIAPPRLGTLLRGARKQRSLTRREVAHRVGTTPGALRRYERGDTPVPPSLVAQLAECYGEDLAAQFATRAPVYVGSQNIVVGHEVERLDATDGDEVLGTYVALVARLRGSRPGAPIALRADDVVALSSALGQATDRVEERIVELLGCTPLEAHSLHAEMLRRKLVVPVAGLVTGLAVVTGVGMAVAGASTAGNPPHAAAVAVTQVVATPTTAAPEPVAPKAAEATPAPATTTAPAVTPTTTAAPAAEPTPAAAPAADPAPTPTTEEVAPAATPMPRPVITTDTTPMSVPPHETVKIIQP